MTSSFTLDWNCVIAVEQNEPSSQYLNDLYAAHRRAEISLGITTVSACENLPGSRTFPETSAQFIDRLERIGWSGIEHIYAPRISSFSYIGMCIIVDDDFEAERDAIWNVLFPNLSKSLPRGISSDGFWSRPFSKYRNAMCDVLTIWTHINSGRDILVTSNTKDFQNNQVALRQLGLGKVPPPKEAAATLVK